jgi:hypothetical protein
MVVMILVSWAHPSTALPVRGDRPCDFTVEDADGRKASLSELKGWAVLIMYEDRIAADMNRAFKMRLEKMARARTVPPNLAIMAIADLRLFQAWPAKKYARNALRKQQEQLGTPLFADWDGTAGNCLDVPPQSSTLILLDPDGKAVWASTGPLSAGRQKRLVKLLGTTGSSIRAGRPPLPAALVVPIPGDDEAGPTPASGTPRIVPPPPRPPIPAQRPRSTGDPESPPSAVVEEPVVPYEPPDQPPDHSPAPDPGAAPPVSTPE